MRAIKQKTIDYRFRRALAVCCALILLAASSGRLARADEPVVRAVLFYSPSCGHCHKIITEDLPPLVEKYSDKLQIIGVNVAEAGGQALYQAAIQRYNIPDDRLGVPTLIIDDIVLVGSGEIPDQLPGLVEKYLAQGGVDWPDIPGLVEAIAVAEAASTATPAAATTPEASPSPAPIEAATATPMPPQPTSTAAPTGLIVTNNSPPSLSEKISRDLAGNALAIAALLGMVCVVGYVGVTFPRLLVKQSSRQAWAIPLLALLGLGVAAYLAFVETQQVTAVCGPVGDCNTVQQSEYALLFGFLHVGVLGVIGYIAILVAWLVSRYGFGQLAQLASAAMFAMTLFGTLFSIYLTFLEPFVIGATCAWCLTSAVAMTILLWLAATPGARAISNLFNGEENVKRQSATSPISSQRS